MTVTNAELAGYLGASEDDPNLPVLLASSEDMIDDYLKENIDKVPDSVLDLATMQLASELWVRRNSPGGIASWGPDGSVPARLAKDPMTSVYPLLSKYRSIGAVG